MSYRKTIRNAWTPAHKAAVEEWRYLKANVAKLTPDERGAVEVAVRRHLAAKEALALVERARRRLPIQARNPGGKCGHRLAPDEQRKVTRAELRKQRVREAQRRFQAAERERIKNGVPLAIPIAGGNGVSYELKAPWPADAPRFEDAKTTDGGWLYTPRRT